MRAIWLIILLGFIHFYVGSSNSVLATQNKPTSTTKSKKEPSLVHAIIYRDIKKAFELISSGIDVNLTDKYGQTALMLAANFGDLELVKVLIAKGANVNALGGVPTDRTPLMHVGINQFTYEIAKVLIEAGADVNIRGGYGQTVLGERAADIEFVKILLKAKADVNTSDDSGQTPLLQAVRNSQATELLIAAGADVNHKDKYGKTPLMQAAFVGESKSVELLLTAGANPDAIDSNGKSALDYAIKEQGNLKTIQLLKKLPVLDEEVYYLESWKKGNGSIQEKLIQVDLNHKNSNFEAFIKDRSGSDKYKLSIIKIEASKAVQKSLGVDKEAVLGWSIILQDKGILKSKDNLLSEARYDPYQDYFTEKDGFSSISSGLGLELPLHLKRVMKIEGFYCFFSVKNQEFADNEKKTFKSITLEIEFVNTLPEKLQRIFN